MILLITVTLCKKDILHKEINEPCNEWVISLNCKRCKGFSVPLMKFSFFCFPAHLTAPDISNRSINNCSYRPVRASPSVESCRECENEAPPPPPPLFFFYILFLLRALPLSPIPKRACWDDVCTQWLLIFSALLVLLGLSQLDFCTCISEAKHMMMWTIYSFLVHSTYKI